MAVLERLTLATWPKCPAQEMRVPSGMRRVLSVVYQPTITALLGRKLKHSADCIQTGGQRASVHRQTGALSFYNVSNLLNLRVA